MEILGAGNGDIWYKSSHQLSCLSKMINIQASHKLNSYILTMYFLHPVSPVVMGGTFLAHFWCRQLFECNYTLYEVMLKLSGRSTSAANCRKLWPSQGIAVVAEFADKDLHNCILDSRRNSFFLTLFPITLSTVFSGLCVPQCLFFSPLPEKMWNEEQKSSNNSIFTSFRSYLQLQEWDVHHRG